MLSNRESNAVMKGMTLLLLLVTAQELLCSSVKTIVSGTMILLYYIFVTRYSHHLKLYKNNPLMFFPGMLK